MNLQLLAATGNEGSEYINIGTFMHTSIYVCIRISWWDSAQSKGRGDSFEKETLGYIF